MLLPKRSISGPYKHNPKMSGTTTIMAPDTPDLAGRPTYRVKKNVGVVVTVLISCLVNSPCNNSFNSTFMTSCFRNIHERRILLISHTFHKCASRLMYLGRLTGCISLENFSTQCSNVTATTTSSKVTGHTPAFARVPAITAPF